LISPVWTSCLLFQPSEHHSYITSEKSLANADKMAKTASILNWAPMLTVFVATVAAKVTPSEANSKSMQQKVAQALPGKLKERMRVNHSLSSIHLNSAVSDMSPLSDLTGTINGIPSPLPLWKLKKPCLKSQQVQDKHERKIEWFIIEQNRKQNQISTRV
jgi:hypothetical protein